MVRELPKITSQTPDECAIDMFFFVKSKLHMDHDINNILIRDKQINNCLSHRVAMLLKIHANANLGQEKVIFACNIFYFLCPGVAKMFPSRFDLQKFPFFRSKRKWVIKYSVIYIYIFLVLFMEYNLIGHQFQLWC